MSNRRKGHDHERRIAAELTALRGRTYATARAVAPHLDSRGIDVLSEDDVFDVQCKVGFNVAPLRAYEEMTVREGKIRVVAVQRTKGKGRPMLRGVFIGWDDFVWIAEALNEVEL